MTSAASSASSTAQVFAVLFQEGEKILEQYAHTNTYSPDVITILDEYRSKLQVVPINNNTRNDLMRRINKLTNQVTDAKMSTELKPDDVFQLLPPSSKTSLPQNKLTI